VPLEDLLRRMGNKTGPQWTVSRRFSELDAAHDWGAIPPHVWDEMPETSKAEMIAFTRTKSQMQEFDSWLAEKKRESAPKPGRRR
jgi:hypothetical protein